MTLSLNHNFINAANIELVYDLLVKRKHDVEKEIEDVISMNVYTNEEINNIKENILKLDLKINFKIFNQLIEKIKNERENFVNFFNANNIGNALIDINEVNKENICKISEIYCTCDEDICKTCYYLMMKFDLTIIKKFYEFKNI